MPPRFGTMTVSRSAVMVVLILLTTFVLVSVYGKDVTAVEYDDPLRRTDANARQQNDTEPSVSDHRQGRASFHAEVPSSKAKREQALRNILAARRRQILNQRPLDSPRNPNRTPKPIESSPMDSPDILEAQETKHGLYVTANIRTESTTEEESSELSIKNFENITAQSIKDSEIEFVSKEPNDTMSIEETTRKPNEENFMAFSIEGKPGSGNSRSNYTIAHRNSSASTFSQTSSSLVGGAQKSVDADGRRKNIVSMPESLYNYFRPVESNIPVEDMSQFLYFGQKIQPEVQNSTGNNSVEVTSTVPTLLNSRRRYSMKRLGATTPLTVPKFEEIMNEEMNIAVERQTVEKNKVSKIKNTFRSPENGIYYRKNRPTDPTIASNVIPIREPARNSTEIDSPGEKFRDDNPSAHARIQEQLQHERGSATHVLAETRNATKSTQIPHQQPVSANAYKESNIESEISLKNHQVDRPNEPFDSGGLKDSEKIESKRRKSESSYSNDGKIGKEIAEDTKTSDINIEDTEEIGPSIETSTDLSQKTSTIGTTDNSKFSNPDSPQDPRSSRETNNIETSTSRNKTPTIPSLPSWQTSPESSTLRIIVTEENSERSSTVTTDPSKYTVKPVDSTEERVHGLASGDIPTPKVMSSTAKNSIVSESSLQATILREEKNEGEDRQDRDRQEEQHQQQHQQQHQEQHQQQHQQQQHQQHHQQHQQQHVYAYTITNVTRLLRNYTGPGLSREEQGGPRRSTGTAEITTGSPQRRQPPPPPSLLLLPRTGSGIEAVRAPAELSAGTTVEAVAAGGPSAVHLVGERQRKVVAVGPQSQQRAPSRTSLQLTVNKSAARPGKPTEVTSRGPVRWNRTKARNSDLDGFNDRRFLRKSASAVLNQRIGANVDEEGVGIGKRRRVGTNGLGTGAATATSSFSSYSSGNRRIKGSLVKSTEDRLKDRTIDGSILKGERTNLENERIMEVVMEGRDEISVGEENRESGIVENTTMGIVEDRYNMSVNTKVEDDTGVVTTTGIFGDTMDEDRMNFTDTVVLENGNIEIDTKDGNNTVQNESESVAVNGNARSNLNASEDKTGDNGSGSSTVTVTATIETVQSKETSSTTTTTTTTTAIPTPVFPVTPKIITEAARVPTEQETFTLKSTESVNQVAEDGTTELNQPSVTSDPLEIQRKYRSKNVTTETPITSTIESTTSQDQSTFSMKSDEIETSTMIPQVTEPRKHISGERSPEVRGRNLSDESTDKDDVLPIMHLYNTSDIFNGSTDSSYGTERRVELPVDAEISVTTEKSNEINETITKIPITEETKSTDIPFVNSTRKDKQDENRGVSSQVPPTGPGRGSSFVNGTNNRTRHRPVYHHAILPEYNGSLYPGEFNRTFFETGLISVSPRESVNISEVISKRHDGDAIASQETVAVVSYILATLVVFPIAVGVGLILRRLILRNRKVLEESDTSSEISCRKDALNLENGDFKTSIEKAITKLPRIQHLCHEAEKPPPPSAQESRWEFPRDKLRLQTVLGQGNFGQVWKAEADDLTGHQGTTRLVAVKTVKEGASDREKEDLVRELEIMQQLGSHPNVVTLLGCCTEKEPHYLILEYVMYGKLLAYLRDHRTRQDFYNFSEDSAALTSRDLTVFGYCVARGMEYLASKKIIHRDLAARNVLVDHNKLCKIADFGMSRFANEDGEVIETRHGRNALPIRWMAPESLIYSLFTTKTDVWSFGILMWEIVTLGSTPYPDMTAREVMRNVQNGYRLERPSHCRSELFRVISRCWHADPDRRPEFQTLRRDLAQLLEDNMNGHYVDLESFASECTD